jgi:hypothetical protein
MNLAPAYQSNFLNIIFGFQLNVSRIDSEDKTNSCGSYRSYVFSGLPTPP